MAEPPAVRRYKNAIGRIDPSVRSLMPWEFAYCEWYAEASQVKRQSLDVRIAKAQEVAPEGMQPGRRYVERLHLCAAFREYNKAIKLDNLSAARKKLKGSSVKFAAAHIAGLDMALLAEDYKAIPAFTNPMIDRIIPKNSAADAAAVAIQINISSVRQELLEEPPLEIEYEVIDDGTDPDDT